MTRKAWAWKPSGRPISITSLAYRKSHVSHFWEPGKIVRVTVKIVEVKK